VHKVPAEIIIGLHGSAYIDNYTYLDVCLRAMTHPDYYSEWKYRRLCFIGPVLSEVRYPKELLLKAEELRCYAGYTRIESVN